MNTFTKFGWQLYCCVLTLDVSIYICFFLSLRRGPKSMIAAARANFELNINNYCKLSVGTRMKRIAKIIGCYWTITGQMISAWLVISSWQWTQCTGRGAKCETVAALLQTKAIRRFVIMEKAPTRGLSMWNWVHNAKVIRDGRLG